MCIFPSDGTGRIRFTGQDGIASNLSRLARHPEDVCALRSVIIIPDGRDLSSLGSGKKNAENN